MASDWFHSFFFVLLLSLQPSGKLPTRIQGQCCLNNGDSRRSRSKMSGHLHHTGHNRCSKWSYGSLITCALFLLLQIHLGSSQVFPPRPSCKFISQQFNKTMHIKKRIFLSLCRSVSWGSAFLRNKTPNGERVTNMGHELVTFRARLSWSLS